MHMEQRSTDGGNNLVSNILCIIDGRDIEIGVKICDF